MKITFPHMGNVYIAVEAFLRGLGHEPVTPPPSSRRTLELGSFHSPAEVCLPFKIALGTCWREWPKGGGGAHDRRLGPCRLGYYAEIQRLLLQALGREVEFITLEVPRRPYAPYAANLRKLIAPRGSVPWPGARVSAGLSSRRWKSWKALPSRYGPGDAARCRHGVSPGAAGTFACRRDGSRGGRAPTGGAPGPPTACGP